MYPEIFEKFDFKTGRLDADRIYTRCGSIQLRKFDQELANEMGFSDDEYFNFYCNKRIMTQNEGVFEWLDICETIDCAKHNYTFVELGAGYARWAVIAYAIATKLRSLSTRLVIVEAEPTHFEWLKENLSINNIEARNHYLFRGAVDKSDGYVLFQTGKPSAWYGQSVVASSLLKMIRLKVKFWYKRMVSRNNHNSPDEDAAIVKSYSLNTILKGVDLVDLIHMDIQGKEFEVISAALPTLTRKVKRLHIGTHSAEVEEKLYQLMASAGWTCLRVYSGHKNQLTPFGQMAFGDGIQTWVNRSL